MDTSVWIDFLSPAPRPAGNELRRMIASAEPIALSGIVVTEILQGLARDVQRIERLLSLWPLLEPKGIETYSEAATIYRLGRKSGVTLSTIDALLAAIALANHAQLFTLDTDFDRIARLGGLRLYTFTPA